MIKYILVESRYKTYKELTKQFGREPVVYIDYNWQQTKLIVKHFCKQPHMEKFQYAGCSDLSQHDLKNILSPEFYEVYNKILPHQDIYTRCVSNLDIWPEANRQAKITAAPSVIDATNKFLISSADNFNMLKNSKATHIFFFDIPHGVATFNLYLVAKAMGLKVIICRQFLANTFYITESIENTIRQDIKGNNSKKIIDFNKQIVSPPYMKNKTGKILFPTKLLFRIFKRALLIFPIFVRYHRLAIRYLVYNFETEYYSYKYKKHFHKKYVSTTSDLTKTSYVYFPLHYQPEMTTSTLGGKYNNQAAAVRDLRQKLPPEVMIIIKENPIQSWYMRDESFFATIKNLPNTIFVATSTSSYELIKHSMAVAVISGTAGYEALFYRKPIIYFGKPFYQNFEGAFAFDKIQDIKEVLHYVIDEDRLLEDAEKFNSRLFKGSIDIYNLGAFNTSYNKKTFDLDKNFSQMVKAIISYLEQTSAS